MLINNQIQDRFPSWLQTLPKLRVLVLRSNHFHGDMSPSSSLQQPFPKLQVFDISRNEINGSLPDRYIKNFKAMVNVNESEVDADTQTFLTNLKLIVTMKGSDRLVERLLTTFISIDLSSNRFSHNIPDSIGDLLYLKYLNLSHNNLTGHMPASLGNLAQLESLDLSGEIPPQLGKLTFLSKLNLSMNNLVGPIPQSRQLSTFENNSYMGNLELCGLPLTKTCETNNGQPSIPTLAEEDDGSDFVDGFGWKAVALGYGCGFLLGVIMGYFKRPKWLVHFF